MFNKIKYHLALLLAGCFWGSVSLFSGLLSRDGVDVFSQIFLRLVFGVFITLLLYRFFKKQNLSLSIKEVKYLLINSFLTLASMTFFMISVYLGTPIAKAIALVYFYPISTVVLSYLFFKDLPSLKNWLGISLSIVSVLILLEVWSINNLTQIKAGDILALIDSFFTAAVIVYGRKIKMDIKLNSFKAFFYTLLFMIPQLIFFGFILNVFGVGILKPTLNLSLQLKTWIYIISLASFGTALTFPLLYIGLSKVKAHIAGILLLTEPVWAYIFGLIFLSQSLSIWGLIGMIGVIISVLFI